MGKEKIKKASKASKASENGQKKGYNFSEKSRAFALRKTLEKELGAARVSIGTSSLVLFSKKKHSLKPSGSLPNLKVHVETFKRHSESDLLKHASSSETATISTESASSQSFSKLSERAIQQHVSSDITELEEMFGNFVNIDSDDEGALSHPIAPPSLG
ncbi:MAG: hypothetical protein P1U32_07985 [Legionellaceae bacterium]|nr:hypothetical protein [Legionellaceae bacterium]